MALVKAVQLDDATTITNLVTPIIAEKWPTIAVWQAFVDVVTADVKAAIFEKANEVLTGQPYVVKYVQKTTDGKTDDDFTFKPYTYKENGEIAYSLCIYPLSGDTLNGDDGYADAVADDAAMLTDSTITLAKTTLNADAALQTVSQAKADIKEVLEAVDNWSNTTDAAAVLAKVTSANVVKDSNITVAVKKDNAEAEDFTLSPATFKADGKLTGTLVISKEETKEEYAYDFVITKLKANDETVVRAEVTRALSAIEVTNADADDTKPEGADQSPKAAKEAAIIAKAQEIVNDSGYTIDKNEDTSLTVTSATSSAAGEAKLTFTLKAAEGGSASNPTQGDLEIKWTIPQLEADTPETSET